MPCKIAGCAELKLTGPQPCRTDTIHGLYCVGYQARSTRLVMSPKSNRQKICAPQVRSEELQHAEMESSLSPVQRAGRGIEAPQRHLSNVGRRHAALGHQSNSQSAGFLRCRPQKQMPHSEGRDLRTSVISPKSRMQIWPSGVRMRLPGWGSACRKPVSSSWIR